MECVWDIKIKSSQRQNWIYVWAWTQSFQQMNMNHWNGLDSGCMWIFVLLKGEPTQVRYLYPDMFSSVCPVFSSTFLILSSFTFPAEEKHSYTIMLPLPWFTMTKVWSVNFLLCICLCSFHFQIMGDWMFRWNRAWWYFQKLEIRFCNLTLIKTSPRFSPWPVCCVFWSSWCCLCSKKNSEAYRKHLNLYWNWIT